MKKLTVKQAEKKLVKYCIQKQFSDSAEWGINVYTDTSITFKVDNMNIIIDLNNVNIVEVHR